MDDFITLAHGAGGKKTSGLIKSIFEKHFRNELLTADDAAVLPFSGGRLVMSTDGFVVAPAFFSGGDIGKLSICGTVNDLSCMGAKPLYISVSFVIEEGFPLNELDRIAESIGRTAAEVPVSIVCGDTKVVARGQADGVYITTTGAGILPDGAPSPAGGLARPGDVCIVTGDVGKHGAAVLVSRGDYGLSSDIESDCAPLYKPVAALLEKVPGVRVIRDATRGGVGTVCHEIARQSGVGVRLSREQIPVGERVKGLCSLLGLEPLYLACEGRMVMVVPEADEEAALSVLHGFEETKGAKRIGVITAENEGRVTVTTEIGTETYLPEPGNELLPRIC